LNQALLEAIEDFFDREASSPRAPPDPRVPAVALLLLLVRADHETRPDEHRVLEQALRHAYALTIDETAMLVRRSEEAIEKGARLPDLTATLQKSLSPDHRKDVLRTLWRVAYADAELSAHEEYLIRKVAPLLGLGSADLIEQKLRAREEFLRDDL
jgi:uncharacterized tellurite resistance protein B-like protein